MTTLQGETLFNYISHLQSELSELDGCAENDQFSSPHHFLNQILEAEKIFLKNYHCGNNDASSLSFTGNGLPSIDSLIPDLEKMCELSGECQQFHEIESSFQRDSASIERNSYETIERKKYDKKKKTIKDRLKTETKFSLRETDDRALELILREEDYIDSIDEHSQKIPIAIKENNAQYRIIFGELMYHHNEKFYLAKTDFIKTCENSSFVEDTPFKEVVKNMLKISYSAGAGIGLIAGKVIASPFLFPTTYRKLMEQDEYIDAKFLSFFTGSSYLVAHLAITGFFNPEIYDVPLWPAIPMITNLTNGVYEFYRYTKNI